MSLGISQYRKYVEHLDVSDKEKDAYLAELLQITEIAVNLCLGEAVYGANK